MVLEGEAAYECWEAVFDYEEIKVNSDPIKIRNSGLVLNFLP